MLKLHLQSFQMILSEYFNEYEINRSMKVIISQ